MIKLFRRQRLPEMIGRHNYDPLRGSQETKPKWMSDPDHIAPSGKAFAFIHTQGWGPEPASRWQIQGHVDKLHEAASYWGVSEYEVWRKNSHRGQVVMLGNTDQLAHARILIRVLGDQRGDHRHSQNFTDCSDEYITRWVNAARALLDRNGIPFHFHQPTNNRAEFFFDRLSYCNAFSIVVDRGLFDQLARGENLTIEFPQVEGPRRKIGHEPFLQIDHSKRHDR